jgi:hypothetical protein
MDYEPSFASDFLIIALGTTVFMGWFLFHFLEEQLLFSENIMILTVRKGL